MKKIKKLTCSCGEDVYENDYPDNPENGDDVACVNCGKVFGQDELDSVEIAEITSESLQNKHVPYWPVVGGAHECRNCGEQNYVDSSACPSSIEVKHNKIGAFCTMPNCSKEHTPIEIDVCKTNLERVHIEEYKNGLRDSKKKIQELKDYGWAFQDAIDKL